MTLDALRSRPAHARPPLPFTLDANAGLITSRAVLARSPVLQRQFEAAQQLHDHNKRFTPMNRPLWQTYPIVFWTLLIAALVPAMLLVTATGAALSTVWPEPQALAVLVGLVVLVGMLVAGLLLGVLAWLLVARRFVEPSVAARFFLDPGVPLFSTLCVQLFHAAYPKPRRLRS